MTSTINASSTGSGGIVQTADASGVLALQANGTTAFTVNSDATTTFASAANLPNTFGFKNRLINGNMTIDQRNAGASVATTTASAFTYTVDRWAYYGTVASKFTVQRTPSATETGYATRVGAGFTNYLAMTSTSAYSSGASEIFLMSQCIEGFNFFDVAWGTANAKTVTLSFLAYSSITGTQSGSISNAAGTQTYPFTFTVSSANTWTQVSITIPGSTSGTWATDNTQSAYLFFNMGSGSARLGTANAWTGTVCYGVTGSVSVIGTSGATFYITGVQLEKGSTATSFDFRSYGTELALCQRYYYKTFPQATAPAQNTTVYSGAINYVAVLAGANYMSAPVFFPVVMRATPTTITFYNPGAANAKWKNGSSGSDSGNAVTNAGASQNGFVAVNNPQVAGDSINNTIYIHATAEAEL
jgi:hypothetical protein